METAWAFAHGLCAEISKIFLRFNIITGGTKWQEGTVTRIIPVNADIALDINGHTVTRAG